MAEQPSDLFPKRIMDLLQDISTPDGGPNRGPWEDGNGRRLDADARKAVKWIKSRAALSQPSTEQGWKPVDSGTMMTILLQLGFPMVDDEILKRFRECEAVVLKVLNAKAQGYPASEGWTGISQPSTDQGWTHEINQELERQYLKGFQAGKAFEREQCALVCDRYGEKMFGGAIGAQKCAAAIRSRKDAP